MFIVDRSLRFVYGFLLSYGPSRIKKLIWDRDFAAGKWNFTDNTASDCVYPALEKYARKGSILDLGCGAGNTANELAATAYQTYVGVDISEVALDKARRRSQESGRTDKHSFTQGDFLRYEPTQQFDVILFRESLYHVPLGKVKATLDRYSGFLRQDGVFIARMFTSQNGRSKHRPKAAIGIIETHFEVVEKSEHGESGLIVIVFRPRCDNG